MIERMFVWTWDARPFSFWPDLTDFWRDGGQWQFGHWVQGKLGMSGLAAILEELSNKSGLDITDIDASEVTDLVRGYVLTSQQSSKDAIQSLRQAYFFDVVESDNIVKFVPRGGDTAIIIEEEDLIPTDKNGSRDLLTITRTKELDLPKKIDVNYISNIADYQVGNQHSQRQTVSSLNVESIGLSVVLSDQEAKTIADISMYNQWVARVQYSFELPVEYATLEPTDIIDIIYKGVTHKIRITSTHYGKPGVLQVSGVAEDIAVYDFYNAPGSTGDGSSGIEDGGLTDLTLLDLPTLPADAGTSGTIHFAMAGTVAAWSGSTTNRSDDGGATYFPLLSVTTSTIKGVTEDILGSTNFHNNIDNSNTVTVILLEGELASVNDLALLNGANIAVIGSEVIQFKTATLIEPNKYTLSGLLRGRLGTEDKISGHVVGETFVLIDGNVPKLEMPNGLINLPRKYKAVTFGNTLAETTEQDFTFTAQALKPLSPVHILGDRDLSQNLTITWVRRTRVGGEWLDNVDAQLGETSEEYEVDIMNGGTVVRTFSGLTSPTVTYTAAEQVTDFGGAQSSVLVNIYQISSAVGRGKVGIKTI
jgi:hypothetical protein